MKLQALIKVLQAAECRYLEEFSREAEVVKITTFDDIPGEFVLELREGVKARSSKNGSIEEVFGPQKNQMIRL